MSDIIFGADGTGPDNASTYAADFASSHVRNFTLSSAGFHSGYYWRGPTAAGSETISISTGVANRAAELFKKLRDLHQADPKARPTMPRIFLTGYSRGAAAVIDAAYRLEALSIPVHCMLLFDAVDRSSVDNRVDKIPGNVKFCYHAMRADSAESREIFGNCGTTAAGKVVFVTNRFHCTHGAMGGTPWKTAGEDGTIEEVGAGSKSKAVAFAAGGVGGLYALHKVDKTKVTLKQENTGSAAVLSWMKAYFQIAKSA